MIMLFLLVLAWVFLTGELTLGNVGFGFILSSLLLLFLGRAMQINYFNFTREESAEPNGKNPLRRAWTILTFILFFLLELVKAGLTVFASILAPDLLRPGVVAVPLDLKTNAEITLLANLITLTPGTLSLDVSSDRRVIYVHTIRMEDPESFRHSIKDGFEKRIMEVMR